MNADRELGILERFRGVRRVGGGWRVLCPAHDDRDPSLSVHVRGGRILLYCHAGCTLEAVLAAAGIEKRELFLDADPPWREVAEYSYHDERGVLLYQVVRRERLRRGEREKDFRQRRPDGHGGWIWNLNGVRRVLYRLPEVIAARSVLVVEGEKDCEIAGRLALVATCNPNGAGKWRPEYSEALRGKRVAIIADADEAGRKHAQQVAASVSGKAASVRLLELPGAKDLSQWAEHGGTRERLLGIIRDTPEYGSPEVPQQPRIELVHMDAFLARQSETEFPALVERLIPARSQTVWQGRPKVGKSHTLLQLGFDLAAGLPVFGHFPVDRPVRVAYVELEEPESETKRRMAAMLRAHGGRGPDRGNLAFFTRTDLNRQKLLPRELLYGRRKDLSAAFRDLGIELAIFVALRRLFVGELKDPQAAEVFNDALDLFAEETGAAVILAHHDRKKPGETVESQGMGSTMFSARADAIFDLSRMKDGPRRVQVEARYDVKEEFCLVKEPVGEGELIRFVETPDDPREAQRQAVCERVAQGESIHHAAEAEGVPYSTAQRWASDVD